MLFDTSLKTFYFSVIQQESYFSQLSSIASETSQIHKTKLFQIHKTYFVFSLSICKIQPIIYMLDNHQCVNTKCMKLQHVTDSKNEIFLSKTHSFYFNIFFILVRIKYAAVFFEVVCHVSLCSFRPDNLVMTFNERQVSLFKIYQI